jgi:Uma2 family endonuclease
MTTREKLTAAQFDAFLAQPENAHRRLELISGEIVEKMPTQLHAAIISLVNFILMLYLREHPIGYALTEARYRLPGNDEDDFIPDLSFVTKEHGPLIRIGPAPYFPDLAVEAQSEGQSDRFMLDKALRYLANGTRMVWIIYSTRQIIEVLTPTDRQLLTLTDMLGGGEVLPGFSVPVRELFPVEEADA